MGVSSRGRVILVAVLSVFSLPLPSGPPLAAAQAEEAAEQRAAHPHPGPGQRRQDHCPESPGLGTGRASEHNAHSGWLAG